MNDIFISEVVATRLSHDLIGNIGAVANAVELLNEDDDDDKEDVYHILNFSSNVLSKRLKFFRLCFGLSNASVKNIEELKTVTEDYLGTLGNPNTPITFKMEIDTPQIYKLVMPAVMMMADTLVKGGEIQVIQKEHGIHITAVSDVPLNQSKLKNIDLVTQGRKAEENPSTYAPLYYLMQYLEGNDVPVKRAENTLIVGE